MPLQSAALLAGFVFVAPLQAAEVPGIRSAVERYYQAIEDEDPEAYFVLWSRTAQRPQRESVEYLFKSADERFSDIQILRTTAARDRVRVRLSVRRIRTSPPRVPGDPPFVIDRVALAAITFVKEDGEWKVVSEGSPADDLAAAYLSAADEEERNALLSEEPDLLDAVLVAAAARIASQAAMLQQYARAETLYERVVELARRTGSLRAEGEALQSLGNARYFQRKFPEALAAYEQRLEVELQRGDDEAAAAAYGGVGTVRYSLAEYTAALDAYRRALAIQERVDDKASTATTLISVGNIRYLQGDLPGAIREYSRSRDLFRAILDSDGDARALEGLGRTYLAQGDLAGALAAFAGVLAEGRARADRSRQGVATQNIGDVHLRLGNVDPARRFYEESRDHYLSQKDASGAGRVWQALGMTELLGGRFEHAEHAYTTSLSTCTAASDAECTAHATVGLAYAQFARERLRESVASYRKAIAAFGVLGAREAAARAEVGLCQALTGLQDFPAAFEAAARARRAAIASETDDVLWRALAAEARALRGSGALPEALAAARAAVAVVERMHDSAVAKPATALPSDTAAAFATLAILQAEADDAGAAWQTTARLRSVALRNAVAVNEREISQGMTQQDRDRERALATDVLSLLAQAARERGLPRPDRARLASLEERTAAAAAARTQWMDALYARVPDLRLWRGLAPAPGLDDTLAAIPPSTVLLEFIVDEDDVLALLAEPGGEPRVVAKLTTLKRRALAERVNSLLRPAVLKDSHAWRMAASGILELLPSDAPARLAAAATVIVVPHDILWRVPFEALPVGDGLLGDRTQVSYAGSRMALVRSRRRDAPAGGTLAAVSAPALVPAFAERILQVAPDWSLRPGKAGSRETQAVSSVYADDAVVLSGEDAREAAIRDRLESASVLHIAAPFRINGASPLFSPVLLAGPSASQTPGDDGTLDAREVANLTLAARVAVLSDGSATSMRDGAAAAEIVQWAWLAAGVPSVLLARWTSDPESSDALLVEFHRRVRAGTAPAEALLGARDAVRARPQWAAPYHWAGWMLLGN